MDFSMPVCDGPTSCKLIIELLDTAGIKREDQPIICCISAYTEKHYSDVVKAAGMETFLIKPVFKDQLHKLLIKAKLINWTYDLS